MYPEHPIAMRPPRTDTRGRAIARCLEFAESSASVGDYSDALLWLLTVEATIDEPLPAEWREKSRRWKAAREAGRAG